MSGQLTDNAWPCVNLYTFFNLSETIYKTIVIQRKLFLPCGAVVRIKRSQSVSCSIISDSLRPCGLQFSRLLCPRHFPAKILEWVAISISETHERYLEPCLTYSKHSSNCSDYVDFTCREPDYIDCNFLCFLNLLVNDLLIRAQLHLFKKIAACISLQTWKKLKRFLPKAMKVNMISGSKWPSEME